MLIYQITLSIVKIGICTFYLRIFQDKTSKYLVYGIIGFIILTTIPVEFVAIFQCNPIRGAWDIMIESKCIKLNPEIIAFAICNILGDLALIGFAVPRVCKFFFFFNEHIFSYSAFLHNLLKLTKTYLTMNETI